jgi:hypothetical protein
MKPNLSSVIFNADKANGSSVAAGYQASTAKDLGLHECWFQEAIAAEPELVINPCRSHDLTDEDWFFWGREVKVPGNCAVLGDVMKRIGEIEEIIVEMATWFQEQIKRFG